MATHGRDVLVVVVLAEEGIGEALAVSDKFNLVAGVEMAYLHHLLTGTPIDESCRGDIVVYPQQDILHGAVGVVQQHLAELDVGRQRVVVHLDGGELLAPGKVVGADTLMIDYMAEAALLHDHRRAVVEDGLVLGCGRQRQGRQHSSDE